MNYQITGIIYDSKERAISETLLIRAYNITLGNETLIGESLTAKRNPTHGFKTYEIKWEVVANRLQNILLRVFLPNNNSFLGESALVTLLPNQPSTDLNIVISEQEVLTAYLDAQNYEYSLLKTVIEFQTSNIGLSLTDLSQQDIALLEKTLVPQNPDFTSKSINRLIQSEQLAQSSGLPGAFFYAIAMFQERMTMKLDAFLALSDTVIENSVQTAIGRKFIPPLDLEEILEQLLILRTEITPIEYATLVGKIINEVDESPIVNLKVSVSLAGALPFAEDITDVDGQYLINYPKEGVSTPNFRLQIFRESELIATVEKFEPILKITLPPLPDPSPKVATLEAVKGISTATINKLNRQGLDSLKAIRTKPALLDGFSSNIKAKLQSYAAFNLINNLTPTEVEPLVESGFKTIEEVAVTDKATLLAKIGDSLTETKALQLWNQAKSTDALIHGTAIDLGREVYDDRGSSDADNIREEFKDLLDLFPERCGCSDCENAISRTAYITDLLGYALQKVKIKDKALTFDDLTANFYQPFADLPADCQANYTQVRQVRVAMEVLYSYLNENGISVPSKAYKAWVEVVYLQLLEEFGTSYFALRDARMADSEADDSLIQLLKSLRLKYEENNPQETLTKIYKATSDINEAWLESIFGWRSTLRHPLDTNASSPFIIQSKKERLEQIWLERDRERKWPIIDPDLILLDYLVDTLTGDAAELWEERTKQLQDKFEELKQLKVSAVDTIGAFNALFPDGIEVLTDEEENPIIPKKAFTFLEGAKKLINENNILTEGEWAFIYDILVQHHKEQVFYPQWLQEEKEKGLVLNPTTFNIPSLDFSFPPKPLPTLPEWRATNRQLRNWKDILKQRIDQELTIQTDWQNIIRRVEEAQLAQLRDALIEATITTEDVNNGIDHPTKAKWLGEHLLIDMQMDVCQMTTRLQQATEAIQLLVWSLRTGQLTDTHPNWKLLDEDFDDKWKWLRTYVQWRSAMLVHLFPENILYPSLRRWQTPVFKSIVERTRKNGRFSPSDACSVSEEYAQYFEDVSNLEPEASVMTSVKFSNDVCQNSHQAKSGVYTFLFAQSKKTKIVYWSRFDDTKNENGYPQTFWEKVPELDNVLEIIGVRTYEITPKERYIYLFVKLQDGFKQTLNYLRFYLMNGIWENTGATELELPEDSSSFSGVILHHNWETWGPRFAIRLPSGAIYSRWMDREGTDLAGDDWELLVAPSKGKEFSKILGMIAVYELGGYYLIVKSGQEVKYRWFGKLDDGKWRIVGKGDYLGCFPWKQTKEAYVLLREKNQTVAHLLKVNTTSLRITKVSDKEPIEFKLRLVDNWLIRISGLSLKHINFSMPGSGRDISIYQLLLDIGNDNLSDGEAFALFFRKKIYDIYDLISNQNIGKNFDSSWTWTSKLVGKFSDYNSVRDIVETYFKRETKAIFTRWGNEVTKKTLPQSGFEKIIYALNPYHNIGDSRTLFYQRKKFTLVDATVSDAGPITLFSTGPTFLTNKAGVFLGKITKNQNQSFDISRQVRVGNNAVDAYSLTSKNNQQNTNHKQIIKDAFQKNADSSESLLIVLKEAYYFLPIHLGTILQRKGFYDTALDYYSLTYNYTAEKGARKIYYGLIQEEKITNSLSRKSNWLLDPLNPHSIAETRANTYTRFTILRIIRCLLDYANAAFSSDSLESIPRARTLYETALQLLVQPEVILQGDFCDNLIKKIEAKIKVIPEEYQNTLSTIITETSNLGQSELVANTLNTIETTINDASDIKTALTTAKTVLANAKVNIAPSVGIKERLQQKSIVLKETKHRLIGTSLLENVISNSWEGVVPFTNGNDAASSNGNTTSTNEGSTNINEVVILPSFTFCIPDNPVIRAWELEAQLNLYKLRTCRNIDGLERPLEVTNEVFSVSFLPGIGTNVQINLPQNTTLVPTPYRYQILIERAKQLANMAQQMEASFLSSLEKRDAELYQLLKAGQEVELTREGVRLNNLKIREAKDGVVLAELQKDKAEIQEGYYENLLNVDLLGLERLALGFLKTSLALPSSVSWNSVSYSPSGILQTGSTILSTMASQERRRQEWQFAQTLARQDTRIGNQQIRLAKDRLRIVNQEHQISELQSDHAKETLDFLVNKFTNVDLYDWMSNILEGVYSTFLQQATAIAKLAEQQFRFERQEKNLSFIQSDYWEALLTLEESFNQDGERPDRRGLTGSARLLQDISKLDQYALTTNKRKQQLKKNLSLAQLSPSEFQTFRETGVLEFEAAMNWFDHDFPGHYMRQIERVQLSIVALVPPIDSVKATLSNKGISRIVTGEPFFAEEVIKSLPESIGITSALNTGGQFEFDLHQQNELLRPFEGLGVATSWTFEMPKNANVSFDYNTIADIIMTIDYTAMNSSVYKERILAELDNVFSADRAFSFRNEFPDQWYDLHHFELKRGSPTQYFPVSFDVNRTDFPTNISDLKIKGLIVYFVNEGGMGQMAIDVRLNGNGGNQMTVDGLLSSRQNSDWRTLLGQSPLGEWTLKVPQNETVLNWFKDEIIKDILLVITYEGETGNAFE